MNPKYKDIIKQVGEHLNVRKKSIFLRTLLITWPVLLGIAIFYLLNNFLGEEGIKNLIFTFPYYIIVIAYLILSFIYIWSFTFIFDIEKRIWIDSYFDNKILSTKESWSISKKLFWPVFKFRLYVFVRYYFLAAIIFWLVVGGVMYSIFSEGFGYREGFPPEVAVLAAAMIGIYFYQYYMRIKLRFSWFVFLDIYKGGSVNLRELFTLMKELNTLAKSEGFKKALVLNLGTDSVKAIVSTTLEIMSNGVAGAIGKIPNAGMLGRAVGDITKTYTQSATEQFASYAEIVSMYILYRVVRKEKYGDEQEINEFIYQLK